MKDKNIVAGLHYGHDCSFVVLENGRPKIHLELERFLRIKEPAGDALKFMDDHYGATKDIVYTRCFEPKKWSIQKTWPCSAAWLKSLGEDFVYGHHFSHAANAFYSSNFENALVVTIDGGGWDIVSLTGEPEKPHSLSLTIWEGTGTKLKPLGIIPCDSANVGEVWTKCTKKVFGLNGGFPHGHQAGSVMAMAAMGDPTKYTGLFLDAGFNADKIRFEALGTVARKSEQDSFDIAAGLQRDTEELIKTILTRVIKDVKPKNICFSGGVALNSVMMGRMLNWWPDIENIYVCPVPYDGGLCIGTAQAYWHLELGNERIKWKDNFTPYLGRTYSEDEVSETVKRYEQFGCIESETATYSDVAKLLSQDDNVISVFAGGSESGRRALGNRSILADPRNKNMKDILNKKVKHRQWFRPFAPSILRESVGDWFKKDVQSPYMSFVLEFKDEVKDKVPAVVHLDGTARLQTVTKNDNEWYYSFIKEWEKVSGVPIVLNTSFNDREPIVETPEHAVNCFLKTDIDYLYFGDYGILVRKK